MKMFNEAGQAVYFNRIMKNGKEQFVVKALSGQHIMGRDRQKHSSRTFTELHQAEAFLRRVRRRKTNLFPSRCLQIRCIVG